MALVRSYEQVMENVQRFNLDLMRSKEMQRLLPYFRVWYYIPEMNQVGPSKFVGYGAMTAERYLESVPDLDGRDSEECLRQWFDSAQADTSEFASIDVAMEALFDQYGKGWNANSKYRKPIGWIVGRHTNSSHRAGPDPSDVVELLWRVYSTLSTEEQRALAERIRGVA